MRECPGVETGLPSQEADGVKNGDLAGLKELEASQLTQDFLNMECGDN